MDPFSIRMDNGIRSINSSIKTFIKTVYYSNNMVKKVEKVGTNLFAILSLIFSIVFSPGGLILGIIALNQIKRTGEEGRILAIIGIIISCVKIAFWIIAVLVWMFFVGLIATIIGIGR